jgi:hypothetical protein
VIFWRFKDDGFVHAPDHRYRRLNPLPLLPTHQELLVQEISDKFDAKS